MKNSNKSAKKPLGSKKTNDDRRKDQYLIVVSILEGRNFQRRNGYNLIIEARLDGELMSTDEVEHTEHPFINTELAWEVDRDALRIFRMQRIPIKLQCFAVDVKHGTKDNIGFILLDLRLLHPKPQALKWYPLLHNKYHGLKCELHIGFYLEKDLGMPKQEQIIMPSTMKQKNLLPISNEEILFEQPILNEDEGYYQLGPPDVCKEIFSLSLTIVFADNLMQLIPSTVHLPKDHDGFYFFYVLFGNDVTTDTFPDLISPSFAAERATVRVRSSFKFLRHYLASHPNLQVHLCVGDISLGYAEIPLNKLLKNNMKSLTSPATMEKTFQLRPLKGDVIPSSKNSPAVVGISLSLKSIEKISERDLVIDDPEILNENKSPSSFSSESSLKAQNDSLSPYSSSPPVRLKTRDNKQEMKTSSSFDDLSDVGSKSVKDKIDSNRNTNSDMQKSNVAGSSPRLQAGRDSQEDVFDSVSRHLENDASSSSSVHLNFHHYCFIVDIRHLRLQSVNNSVFCFLRYSYPFFGTSASIFTYPPVEIRGNSQVTLPHGFCAFTFAAGPDQLTMALQNLPLQMEVVQRDKQKSEDVVIGRVSINLGLTLKVNKSRITTEDKKTGYRQTASIETAVVNFDGLKIGELYVVMSLDDFGAINLDAPNRKLHDHHTQNPLGTTNHLDVKSAAVPSQTVPLRKEEEITEPPGWSSEEKPYSELHKQMAVQVAKELQQWKAIQQDYFNKQLAEKEAQYLDSLATEWRKRETEREMLYQRRITECEDMQDKLQRALFDIDKRERILSNREQELLQNKGEFDQKCERQEKEIKLGYIRMQEDFNHRLQLEREKTQEAENQKMKLELQLGELEKKLEAKIHEFEIYREEQRNNPEMRLQSEVHLLALEKAELERKLEAAVKSKVHYKQQWGRCLRELARIKQKLEADARAQLYKQQQELENMRLQYLASEGKDENTVLQEIKGDLNVIKENVSKNNGETASVKNRHISFLDSDGESESEADRINIERLKKEREALLNTGVYTQDDRIIRELDRQIKEAVLRKLT